jgi:hypothetical protein
MCVSWKLKAFFTAILLLETSPSQAGERWSCEFQPYRQGQTSEQADFSVEGSRLVEYSGDAIVDYRLLESSSTALVGAKGGAYASTPSVRGFLVLIDKVTGKSLLAAASGQDVARQAGTCRLVKQRSN